MQETATLSKPKRKTQKTIPENVSYFYTKNDTIKNLLYFGEEPDLLCYPNLTVT